MEKKIAAEEYLGEVPEYKVGQRIQRIREKEINDYRDCKNGDILFTTCFCEIGSIFIITKIENNQVWFSKSGKHQEDGKDMNILQFLIHRIENFINSLINKIYA